MQVAGTALAVVRPPPHPPKKGRRHSVCEGISGGVAEGGKVKQQPLPRSVHFQKSRRAHGWDEGGREVGGGGSGAGQGDSRN